MVTRRKMTLEQYLWLFATISFVVEGAVLVLALVWFGWQGAVVAALLIIAVGAREGTVRLEEIRDRKRADERAILHTMFVGGPDHDAFMRRLREELAKVARREGRL